MKNENKILKLKQKAYRIAKSLLKKHNTGHRKNDRGNWERYNTESHDFKSFRITIEQSTPSRKTFGRGTRLFVSVVVGYKESGHSVLDAINSNYREQTVFTIGERGGLTLWNAAKKNGRHSKTAPKGIQNILYHAKM
jgi:hypothetical protein